jgi:hypothetical protein
MRERAIAVQEAGKQTYAFSIAYEKPPLVRGIRGGIGVSGLTAQEDEDIARLGLRALGL